MMKFWRETLDGVADWRTSKVFGALNMTSVFGANVAAARRLATMVVMGAGMSLAVLATATSAAADEMRFQFTNPSFGGNPFNSSHLLGVANAQNDNERPRSESQQSQADQFVRLLQSRLLSALASQVGESILGENAQPTGRIVYGTQTVEWETLLDSIRLTITEADTGSVTIIEIPKVGGSVG
jgi:curli production assembly/transport component CsgF